MTFEPDFNQALKQNFFLQSPEQVAKKILGKVLVKVEDNGNVLAGIITETEAYLSEGDLSSHSACGLTKRNSPMFAKGGVLYVYKIYGAHHCINFVTEEEGIGSAALIRALEPLKGIKTMINRRGVPDLKKLCKGPGNLAKAFGFNLEDNCKPITSEYLFVQNYLNIEESQIKISERIGISKSKELPLRFQLKI